MKQIFLIPIFLFILQSCAPIISSLSVASLGAASKEKGIATTLNDNIIKTKISNLIFKNDPGLIANTYVFVNNGSVLFTGLPCRESAFKSARLLRLETSVIRLSAKKRYCNFLSEDRQVTFVIELSKMTSALKLTSAASGSTVVIPLP